MDDKTWHAFHVSFNMQVLRWGRGKELVRFGYFGFVFIGNEYRKNRVMIEKKGND